MWQRVLALVIGLACLTVLCIAVWLEPNPAGVGTHTGMNMVGFQPCNFLERTGVPCPSCGMTTSFALLVRGRVFSSLYVQPMGTLLAMATGVTVWVALYVAITGRPVYRMLRVVPGIYWVLPPMFFAVAAWAWKIFIHVKGIDGFN